MGQNIGDGFQSWTGVIDAWFVEVKDFTYNGDHNILEKVGHYTQVSSVCLSKKKKKKRNRDDCQLSKRRSRHTQG